VSVLWRLGTKMLKLIHPASSVMGLTVPSDAYGQVPDELAWFPMDTSASNDVTLAEYTQNCNNVVFTAVTESE